MRKAKLATGQQEQQTQHTDKKNNATQKEALVNITTDTFQKSRLRERTSDRAWFGRLYDIRPGNGACLFLQPRNPHG